MSDEFEEIRLGDICIKIGSGATPTGGKDSYLADGDFALIRSQNVLDFSFSYNGLAFINKAQASKLMNVTVEKEDVLLNITGDSVARVCQVPDDVLPARVNQHVAIIRPKEEKLNSKFLKYYLINPSFKNFMLGMSAVGATRNALTKTMIEDFKLKLPKLPKQRKIATILSSLDYKIELNRQTNHSLEAIAQALFKEWFVDFNFPGATGEMQDSELGEIPKGWRVEPLDKVAEFLNGLALQKFPSKEGDQFLPVIKIRELKNGISANTDKANKDVPEKYIINDGDLLFSWSGTLEVKFWIGGKGALNQHLFKVSSTHYPIWFCYVWTLHHLAEFRRIAEDKATTMGHIQRRHLSEALCLIPDNLVPMTRCMQPLTEQYVNNEQQIQTLTQLRYALLPKLINGEIEISEITE